MSSDSPQPEREDRRPEAEQESNESTDIRPSPLAFLSQSTLSSMSPDHLVQLLMLASQELRKRNSAPQIPESATGALPGTSRLVGDLPLPESITQPSPKAMRFTVLPERLTDAAEEFKNAWRIILSTADPAQPVIAAHIVADVLVGRKADNVSVDLDLSLYDKGELGVSRLHAVIRPSVENLYLSDLGSTNGTWINGQRLTAGSQVALADGMNLTFGKCPFRLSIVARPRID